MKIVNPIYSPAVLFLMGNEKYARKVLSVILDSATKELPYVYEQRKRKFIAALL